MPTTPFRASATLAVLFLAGCARLGPAGDVLFVETSGGLALVRPGSDAPAIRLTDATPSTDWSTVVRAIPRGTNTQVVALDAESGERVWSRDVPGRLEVGVASGDLVALGPRGEAGGYAAGRRSTTLVLAGPDAAEPRTIELDGNFQPEAFSTDRQSLFVVEYLPPEAPDRYRVRRLDLATERVVGVYTVDAELQRAMQGTARVQVASPDGRRLYTLYSLRNPDGSQRAFIHVLSLDELWAHCVDLPAPFGGAAEESVALSLAPDGTRLSVADASTGAVADVDTEALAVVATGRVRFGSQGPLPHAVRGPDGMLYLGSGAGLLAVDASTFVRQRSWDMPGTITGLQAANEDGLLYVGLEDRIAVLDTATGRRVRVLRPRGLDVIDRLGRSTVALQEDRTEIVCAC